MGKAKGKRRQITPPSLTPVLEPLAALQRLVQRFDDRGVIIGGIAVSLLGQPRLTADLDAVFLMSVEDIPELIRLASEEGITPRIEDVTLFARKNRVLLLQYQPSNTPIDISMGILPFEFELVERSTEHPVGPLLLRLPTPEDLIILKAVAHRPKDLEDIKGIAASHSQLDRERIRNWVQQFGDALEIDGLWEKISRYL